MENMDVDVEGETTKLTSAASGNGDSLIGMFDFSLIKICLILEWMQEHLTIL